MDDHAFWLFFCIHFYVWSTDIKEQLQYLSDPLLSLVLRYKRTAKLLVWFIFEFGLEVQKNSYSPCLIYFRVWPWDTKEQLYYILVWSISEFLSRCKRTATELIYNEWDKEFTDVTQLTYQRNGPHIKTLSLGPSWARLRPACYTPVTPSSYPTPAWSPLM